MSADGEIDDTFNIHFLKLSGSEQKRNLDLAKEMICFDYFLLLKFKFFQHYFPEVDRIFSGRKYGYNIKSQLLKLLVIFPGVSILTAWICSFLG